LRYICTDLTTAAYNYGPPQKIRNLCGISITVYYKIFRAFYRGSIYGPTDCIFDEEHFPTLGGEIIPHKQCQKINWDAIAISNHDPCTSESELQVQKIIDLQHITNNTPDAFTDYKDVTKSYNLARNEPTRVEVSNKTTQLPCKRGRYAIIPTDAAPSKQKKRKTKSFKIVSAT
jgi:hypothetical protein